MVVTSLTLLSSAAENIRDNVLWMTTFIFHHKHNELKGKQEGSFTTSRSIESV